jgi:hypothetical protein
MLIALWSASALGAVGPAAADATERLVPWGATGIVAFVVYWLLAKTIPGILRQSRETTDAQAEVMRKLAESVDRNSKAVEKCRWRNSDI